MGRVEEVKEARHRGALAVVASHRHGWWVTWDTNFGHLAIPICYLLIQFIFDTFKGNKTYSIQFNSIDYSLLISKYF